MVLIALLLGAVLIVAAIRGTQGTLFGALGQDVPPFAVWAAAIIAVGALGYVPGLKPVSRGLLALIFVVIVLKGYSQIIASVEAAGAPGQTASSSSSSGGSSSGAAGTVKTLLQTALDNIGASSAGSSAGQDAANAFSGVQSA